MSRLNDIRRRVKSPRTAPYLSAYEATIEADVSYLLDLVERAVPIVEECEAIEGDEWLAPSYWLDEVREEDTQ